MNKVFMCEHHSLGNLQAKKSLISNNIYANHNLNFEDTPVDPLVNMMIALSSLVGALVGGSTD